MNFVEFWNVTSFSTFGGFAYLSNSILPIDLSDFKATAISPNATRLNWSIESTSDIDQIIIQRSADGNTFNEIGDLQPARNPAASTNYSYADYSPFMNANYYRLKIVNNNGNISYSPIRVVRFNDNGGDVTIYPVPVTIGQLTVNTSALRASIGALSVRLFNNMGQVIMNETMQSGTSKNFSIPGYCKGSFIEFGIKIKERL